MSNTIIIGSIVLGLLSAPIAVIKKPRFFWGSAGLDPISFFWMIAFFLYGPCGALISSIIGALSIAFFSREPTPRLGAVLKFTGTLTVWLALYGIVSLASSTTSAAGYFKDVTVYAPSAVLAAIMRCIVEIPACCYAIPYFITRATGTPVSSRMMVEKFGGLFKYILIMVALNFWLTFLDALIPWLLVYPTGIYKRFAAW